MGLWEVLGQLYQILAPEYTITRKRCLINWIKISHILSDIFVEKSTKGTEDLIFAKWDLEKLWSDFGHF